MDVVFLVSVIHSGCGAEHSYPDGRVTRAETCKPVHRPPGLRSSHRPNCIPPSHPAGPLSPLPPRAGEPPSFHQGHPSPVPGVPLLGRPILTRPLGGQVALAGSAGGLPAAHNASRRGRCVSFGHGGASVGHDSSPPLYGSGIAALGGTCKTQARARGLGFCPSRPSIPPASAPEGSISTGSIPLLA